MAAPLDAWAMGMGMALSPYREALEELRIEKERLAQQVALNNEHYSRLCDLTVENEILKKRNHYLFTLFNEAINYKGEKK